MIILAPDVLVAAPENFLGVNAVPARPASVFS